MLARCDRGRSFPRMLLLALVLSSLWFLIALMVFIVLDERLMVRIAAAACVFLSLNAPALVFVVRLFESRFKESAWDRETREELGRIFLSAIGDNGYDTAALYLKDAFASDAAVFGYIHGLDVLCLVSAGGGRRELERWEWQERWGRALEAGPPRRRNGLGPPDWERPFASALEVPVSHRSEALGFFYLLREDRGFSACEQERAAGVADFLRPAMHARLLASRQQYMSDITKRAYKMSEHKLRALFDESRDMIVFTDLEGLITAVNKAGLAMLGYEKESDLLGRPIADFYADKNDRLASEKQLRERGYVDIELILRRKSGETFFAIETGSYIRDTRGERIEYSGIIRDIDERIRSEQKILRMNRELTQSYDELKKTQALVLQREKLSTIGRLAAGVAHEINNPLAFIKSNVEMMSGVFRKSKPLIEAYAGNLPEVAELARKIPEIEEGLRDTEIGIRRIMEIIRSLRGFSRADTDAEQALMDLNACVRETLVVAGNATRYVAEVQTELGELPPVPANIGQIRQVLLNIVVNAAQAIGSQKRADKGLIRVRTRVEKEWVICVIEDDGPGIPESAKENIFVPFFTTKDVGDGTGLGLSISYDIVVNKHGGILTFDSGRKGGAAFTMALPMTAPHSAAEMQSRPTHDDERRAQEDSNLSPTA